MKEKREQSFLLGNEAIARGAVEANIGFAAAYPGTPSTEILQTLAGMAQEYDIYVEWSINEMVAVEGALAASLAGLRAMVSMKHAGLNWALDPLSVAVQGGVRGGLVIVTADDINAHSSANEQDNRFFGLFLRILTLEPSDPQEAKDMTIEAFSLSEKTQLPVILRTVTRVSHARGNVELGEIRLKERQACFEREPERFFITGPRSLQSHSWLLGQQPLLEELAEGLPFNKLDRATGRVCIVTSGVAYTYVKEALSLLNTEELTVLKISSPYPLPKSLIREALSGKDTVLVVEEGAPFIELQLKALVSDISTPVHVLGKMSDHLPEVGELNVGIVSKAIAKLLGQDEYQVSRRQEVLQRAKDVLPPRTMTFCAGCPHSGTMYALKETMRKKPVKPFIAGDIGCYNLMTFPPYELGDVKYSMGASIGVGSAMSKVLNEKTIAIIGDGTFFHAGIPGLINCVYSKANITVIICDNKIIAMTGGQPHPGTGKTVTGQPTKQIDLEELVKVCGVELVEVTDSYDIEGTKETIERALNYDGVSVVISRRECALEASRQARRLGKKLPSYYVDSDMCIDCDLCLRRFSCPALIKLNGKASIADGLCVGCGMCSQICPVDAIKLSGQD